MSVAKIPPEKICAVILAGGFGTRIKHLLGDLPKPMATVNGKPFVEWVIRYLAAQKISNIILSTGYLAETVKKYFQTQPVKNVRVICVPETKPLGTAGGFLNAIRKNGGTDLANKFSDAKLDATKFDAFLVLNGDSLVLAPLEKIFQSLDDEKISGAILGVQISDASRFGTILQNADGNLSGFNEKKPGAGIINAGVYLFRAGLLDKFPQKNPLSFETDVFSNLISQNARLKVCVTDAPFLDIGTPESLPLAEMFVQERQDCFQ